MPKENLWSLHPHACSKKFSQRNMKAYATQLVEVNCLPSVACFEFATITRSQTNFLSSTSFLLRKIIAFNEGQEFSENSYDHRIGLCRDHWIGFNLSLTAIWPSKIPFFPSPPSWTSSEREWDEKKANLPASDSHSKRKFLWNECQNIFPIKSL